MDISIVLSVLLGATLGKLIESPVVNLINSAVYRYRLKKLSKDVSAFLISNESAENYISSMNLEYIKDSLMPEIIVCIDQLIRSTVPSNIFCLAELKKYLERKTKRLSDLYISEVFADDKTKKEIFFKECKKLGNVFSLVSRETGLVPIVSKLPMINSSRFRHILNETGV